MQDAGQRLQAFLETLLSPDAEQQPAGDGPPSPAPADDPLQQILTDLQHEEQRVVSCQLLQEHALAWRIGAVLLGSEAPTNVALNVLSFFRACAQIDKLRRWTFPYIPHLLWLWLTMLSTDERVLDTVEDTIAALYVHCKDVFLDDNASIINVLASFRPATPSPVITSNNRSAIVASLLRLYTMHITSMGPESLTTFAVFCDWLLSTGMRGPLPLISQKHYPMLSSLLRLPPYLAQFYQQAAQDMAANLSSASVNTNNNNAGAVTTSAMLQSLAGYSTNASPVPGAMGVSQPSPVPSTTLTADGYTMMNETLQHQQQWKTVSANTSFSDISAGKVMVNLIASIPAVTKSPLPVLNNTMLRSIVRCLYACSVFTPSQEQRRALAEANIVFDMSPDEIESVRTTTLIADATDTAMPSRGRRLDSTTFLKSHEHHSQLSPVSAAFKSAITDVTALFAKLTGSDRNKQGHDAHAASVQATNGGTAYQDPSAGTLTKVLARRALLRLRDRADIMGELEIAMACKIYQQFD